MQYSLIIIHYIYEREYFNTKYSNAKGIKNFRYKGKPLEGRHTNH